MNNALPVSLIAIVIAGIIIGTSFLFSAALEADRETETSTGRFTQLESFQFRNGRSPTGYIYQDTETGLCIFKTGAGRAVAMTQWPCPDE